ncbi:hypothetical protein V1504DRAFT_224963 [Lipomyces starkeyi]
MFYDMDDLTIADRQMQNLAPAREAIAKTFTTGSAKVSSALGSFWAEIESMREKERIRRETQRQVQASQALSSSTTQKSEKPSSGSPSSQTSESSSTSTSSKRIQHITVTSDPSYLSSWSRWASDKRRQAFGSHKSSSRKSSPSPDSTQQQPPSGLSKVDFVGPPHGGAEAPETTASTTAKLESLEDEDDDDMYGSDSYVPITSDVINPWKPDEK